MKIKRLGPSGSIFTEGKVYEVVDESTPGLLTIIDDTGDIAYASVDVDMGLWKEVEPEKKRKKRKPIGFVDGRIMELSQALKNLDTTHNTEAAKTKEALAKLIRELAEGELERLKEDDE